jgi:anti-anti-sigma factor
METQNLPNATTVVKLIERIDSLTSREVEATLQVVATNGARNIICDCSATKYVSSAGLRVLLLASKTQKKAAGQLMIVCSKTGYVYEVLETAGFTGIIPVFETVEDAAKNAA